MCFLKTVPSVTCVLWYKVFIYTLKEPFSWNQLYQRTMKDRTFKKTIYFQAFQLFDADGDGTITVDELKTLINKVLPFFLVVHKCTQSTMYYLSSWLYISVHNQQCTNFLPGWTLVFTINKVLPFFLVEHKCTQSTMYYLSSWLYISIHNQQGTTFLPGCTLVYTINNVLPFFLVVH